ncbi:MAG: zinc ribbon domain-containing protein [Lachnospiraceae bacterium]|nr:zinc ribbon domain-containing protein [Lachnospiraceae bacterium]
MAFFDGLGGRLQKTGQDAIEKTKKTAEIVRLNSAISDLEREISSAYTEIGKLYYQKNNIEDQDEDMLFYFQKIGEKMEQADEYQSQIRDLKGMVLCVNCGRDIEKNTMYCNFCGAQQIQKISAPQQHQPGKCPRCGSKIKAGQAFCTSCGFSLDAEAEANVNSTEKSLCSFCGCELEKDALFCTNCGRKIQMEEEAIESADLEMTANESSVEESDSEPYAEPDNAFESERKDDVEPENVEVASSDSHDPWEEPEEKSFYNVESNSIGSDLFDSDKIEQMNESLVTIDSKVMPSETEVLKTTENSISLSQEIEVDDIEANAELTESIDVVKSEQENLPGKIFCTNCGEELSPDAFFCTHCGQKV